MTGMVKKSKQLPCVGVVRADIVFRATFIKGDPYIRDMKNTA